MHADVETWPVARALLAPEVVLPVQFFGPVRTRVSGKGGEYRLLAAVLEDAITCFQRHAFASDSRSRRLFAEVNVWILDRGARSDGPFSFGYICAVLGLDADCLSEGLQRWHQNHLTHLESASTGRAGRTVPSRAAARQERYARTARRDNGPASVRPPAMPLSRTR